MTKVQIIGPKSLLDDVIKTLHAMALVHIETVPAGKDIERAFLKRLPLERDKIEEKERLEKASERVRNLLLLLTPPERAQGIRIEGDEIDAFLEDAALVEEEVRGLHGRLDGLSTDLSVIEKYERILRAFAPIVPRLGGLKNFDVVGLTIEKTREDIVGLLSEEVRRITGGSYEIISQDLDETTVGVVLRYPRKHDAMIRHLISGRSINEVRLPDEYGEMTLLDALKVMERKKAGIPALMEDAQRRLKGVSGEWHPRLIALKKAIDDAVDEIGVLTYAAQTRFTFVVEGWVPSESFGGFKGKFSSLFGDRVFIRELEIQVSEADLIPVYIKNPRVLRPFEVFLTVLPPPKYGSVDPTPYIAIFFPAFFGLIVGDAGYGAVLFALSLFLKRAFRDNERLSDIFTVLSVSSLSTVVFGFLFGEFFGDLGERLGIMRPLLFHRAEALKTLLVLTLGIGVGHIALGLVIGAVNRFYRGKTREAGGKLVQIVIMAAFLAVAGTLFGYVPRGFFTPGLILIIASFILLVIIEGVIGPLELIKALGNVLSYMRIMAVGAASVVMAVAANRIGGSSKNFILGIIAAAMIHILNIAISVLSPSIQSLRLQYVEFFSKFYEGGGRRYTPFRKR